MPPAVERAVVSTIAPPSKPPRVPGSAFVVLVHGDGANDLGA